MQLALLAVAFAVRTAETDTPITKVLSLLADLQQKVLQDGEVEQKQYEKFAEFCEDGAVKMQHQIKDAKAAVEEYQATIEKEVATISNAESQIADLAKTMSTNSADLKAATEIRTKEESDFAKADAELADTIDMLGRAIGIIEKNMKGGSFVQVSKVAGVTAALNAVLGAAAVSTQDKAQLQALLQSDSQGDDDFLARSAPDPKAYENHSGGIVETLEDMEDKAKEMRNEAQKAEMHAKHSFQLLAQSLNDALKVDGKIMKETKLQKSSAEEVKATAEGDLARTQKTLAETETALKDLGMDCQEKASDWAASQASRKAELQALADARRIIQETTGGAAGQAYGLIEFKNKAKSSDVAADKVVDRLKKLGRTTEDMAMTQLALRVEAATAMDATADVFAKVRAMIEELMQKLISEAAEEASHKAWCDKEMADSQAKIEDHRAQLDKLQSRIDKAQATIQQLKDSIAAGQKALADISKMQADMDQMRADQKKAFTQAKKDYENGVEGLTMALQILRDYYAKGESFLQQPAVDNHSAATGSATGIIGLLEVAQSDFTKLLADAEVEETAAVREYEKVTQENKVQTATKKADVEYQTKEKASLKKNLSEYQQDSEGEQAELDAVLDYYAKVKPGCTTKPMPYEERKARRESEISGLKEALTILEAESAPESFLAVRTARRA